MIWFGTQRIYIIAINSYVEYYTFFGKKSFSAQVKRFAAWIGYLGGKKLKLKTIKGYLAGLRSLCIECMLNKAKLKVYSHLILQKIIKRLQKIYEERDIQKCQPITCNILLKLISKFDQITLEGANLHVAFCLASVGFL